MCAASAQESMTGKILGTGSVGLTQIAIWFAMAAFGTHRSLYLQTALRVLDVGPSLIVYFIVFYILGYLLYSAIFAGIGAIFNTIDEAQQWNFVVILPLIAASAMILPVATLSDSAIAISASLFPFCSPVLMFERLAVHNPPLWQLILSFVLLIRTICLVMFISGRIYRTGVSDVRQAADIARAFALAALRLTRRFGCFTTRANAAIYPTFGDMRGHARAIADRDSRIRLT